MYAILYAFILKVRTSQTETKSSLLIFKVVKSLDHLMSESLKSILGRMTETRQWSSIVYSVRKFNRK